MGVMGSLLDGSEFSYEKMGIIKTIKNISVDSASNKTVTLDDIPKIIFLYTSSGVSFRVFIIPGFAIVTESGAKEPVLDTEISVESYVTVILSNAYKTIEISSTKIATIQVAYCS